MAQVTIQVNGRDYQVACEDGQEEHLDYLAKYINHHVEDLVGRVGQVGEARLLLMAALQMADELSEVYAELDEIKAGRVPPPPPEEKGALAVMESVAERLERIAARLESA